MCWILLLIVLLILLALILFWRLQRHLLAELHLCRKQNAFLETLIQEPPGSGSVAQSSRYVSPTISKIHSGYQQDLEELMSSPVFLRARLLAEAGRDAKFIASACQMREDDAEWLIRRLHEEKRS